ncbi:MAG: 50S ribosomal protein L19 [Omnitrophica bacterium RIFCSPHIGHO2_02_FULL_46_11]|nr:MAG: 50S ribosomal protein L19 [Omnitrophica bacterium RIFCSPLOWO2_01_FULL_45_10b]OGW87863.1 MAG: 50S ribosomal protein L19 [Omnitrophica bacterium RIFCSPHIGHO2_02_FULL_46_11]
MKKIELIEKDYLQKSIPEFNVGDEVKIHLKVREGDKTRVQIFQGTVIRRRGRGTNATFNVLKEVRDDMVEKVFLLHSPHIEKIQVIQKGKVRRAKLYHLRAKHGVKS